MTIPRRHFFNAAYFCVINEHISFVVFVTLLHMVRDFQHQNCVNTDLLMHPKTCHIPKCFLVWFDFCFTALQHILGHFGHGQLP